MLEYLIGFGFITLVVLTLLFLIHRYFTLRAAGISSPVLGFFNCSGNVGAAELIEDRSTFGQLFKSIQESESRPPVCDVLFIYGELNSDGTVKGHSQSLAEIISEAGARLVIFATGNKSEACSAALKSSRVPGVSLIMTMSRRGNNFPEFYQKLFTGMLRGTSMPVMWNRLAPQYPGADHSNVPESFGLAGAGQISFR